MEVDLDALLDELRANQPDWGDNAAVENMWAVAVTGAQAESVRAFLVAASATYLARARDAGVSPATFYAWCDEQAGQLRFSATPCVAEELPFGAPVRFTDDPGEIAELAVQLRSRIPWEEIVDVTDDAVSQDESTPARVVCVWARPGGVA